MQRKDGGRLRHALLKFYYGYSLYLGMTSHRYDAATGTYKQTRYTRLVALLVNVLTVVLLPWLTMESLHLMDSVQWNPLMVFVNLANEVVRALVILYSAVCRYKRERRIYALMSAVHRLERLHLSGVRPDARVERRLNRIFCLQYVAMAYLYTALVASFFVVERRWRQTDIVLSFLSSHAQNIPLVTTFQYFLAVWYVCRCLCYVNVQLQRLQQQLLVLEAYRRGRTAGVLLCARTARLCSDLEQLVRLHWQLGGIVRQLQAVFNPQMLAIRSSFLMWLVLTGYFCGVIVGILQIPLPMQFFSCLSFLMMMLQIYYVDLICHMTMQHCDETGYALRAFSEYELWSRRLRNTCEQFALQLNCRKLRINLWGLFETDKRFWFNTIASVLGYSIVLVQFHIMFDNSKAT